MVYSMLYSGTKITLSDHEWQNTRCPKIYHSTRLHRESSVWYCTHISCTILSRLSLVCRLSAALGSPSANCPSSAAAGPSAHAPGCGSSMLSKSAISSGSCLRMKLWRVARPGGKCACISISNCGGWTSMRKCHFKTPKIRSMTLRADAWQRLKSSSAFCGLDSLALVNKNSSEMIKIYWRFARLHSWRW